LKGGEILNSVEKYAFDTAKEIVIAKMTSSTTSSDKAGGKNVADFFEEIYDRLLTLSNSKN
jgi:hypothetical protein